MDNDVGLTRVEGCHGIERGKELVNRFLQGLRCCRTLFKGADGGQGSLCGSNGGTQLVHRLLRHLIVCRTHRGVISQFTCLGNDFL